MKSPTATIILKPKSDPIVLDEQGNDIGRGIYKVEILPSLCSRAYRYKLDDKGNKYIDPKTGSVAKEELPIEIVRISGTWER